jgi:hypothetical protein
MIRLDFLAKIIVFATLNLNKPTIGNLVTLQLNRCKTNIKNDLFFRQETAL